LCGLGVAGTSMRNQQTASPHVLLISSTRLGTPLHSLKSPKVGFFEDYMSKD
jgi:hypothetical protein